MRFVSNDDGTWEMEGIREFEFLMLQKLPETTDPTGSEAAAKRLFPTPLGRPPVDDAEDEMVGDWEELVRPDLENQFQSSTKVVVADLAKAKESKVDGESVYRLIVPKKHADDWCSTLNRARLVLHEEFDLPDEDGELDDDCSAGQWLAMMQTDLYGQLMEQIVRRILWLK